MWIFLKKKNRDRQEAMGNKTMEPVAHSLFLRRNDFGKTNGAFWKTEKTD
jgi:hypothetical protein